MTQTSILACFHKSREKTGGAPEPSGAKDITRGGVLFN